MYSAFCKWFEKEKPGRKVTSKAWFCRRLLAAEPLIVPGRPGDAEREHVFVNVLLRN